MKHTIKALIFTAACFCMNNSFAQTVKDVFNNNDLPIFYLGVDFTQAKLIDDPTANENDIRDRQYDGINEVIVAEPKKYDIAKAFHRSDMDHDLGFVNKKNENANAAAIKSTNTGDFHRFTDADVAKVVSSYDFGDKKGVGLMFVTEALSKSKKAVAVWATLLDMQSKKVLMTERVEGEVSRFGGFGFRNYWASAFKDMIDYINKKGYDSWRSKYGN